MKNKSFFVPLVLLAATGSINSKYTVVYRLSPQKSDIKKPIPINKKNILACLQNYLPDNPIIVETGAFDGEGTKKLSLQWPHGTVYAFEPMPENFATLEKNSIHCHNVSCFPLMLGEKNGITEFFYGPYIDTPNISSRLADNYYIAFNTIISVPTVTLDDWGRQNAIKQVDLLWLSGQERVLAMLQASPILLKTVKVIYTEVEFTETHAERCLYKNIKQFLETEGFTLVASDFDESPLYRFGSVVFTRKQ